MLKIVLVFCTCFLGVFSQVPVVGSCPDIPSVQQNFDLNKYLGKWYENQKYFTIFEIGGKCVSAEYSLNDNGTVKVNNKQINEWNGEPKAIIGWAQSAGSADEAKLLVNFPTSLLQIQAPYWVLETDYDNYSVVWSCTELPLISSRFAWILTRERNPSADILEKATAVFDRLGISRDPLSITDQTDCPSD